MDSTYILLQHYWWFLVSLLGALLVFLLFVQGGQSLLFSIGKTEVCFIREELIACADEIKVPSGWGNKPIAVGIFPHYGGDFSPL